MATENDPCAITWKYPFGIVNKTGNYIHYGIWPCPVIWSTPQDWSPSSEGTKWSNRHMVPPVEDANSHPWGWYLRTSEINRHLGHNTIYYSPRNGCTSMTFTGSISRIWIGHYGDFSVSCQAENMNTWPLCWPRGLDRRRTTHNLSH